MRCSNIIVSIILDLQTSRNPESTIFEGKHLVEPSTSTPTMSPPMMHVPGSGDEQSNHVRGRVNGGMSRISADASSLRLARICRTRRSSPLISPYPRIGLTGVPTVWYASDAEKGDIFKHPRPVTILGMQFLKGTRGCL